MYCECIFDPIAKHLAILLEEDVDVVVAFGVMSV